jgi:DNA-binding NarL/FixJ family response regulator
MLVDGARVVREALCALIEQQPDLTVVAQASTVADTTSIGGEPDVIVTDIALPDARNDDVITGLRASFRKNPILVLTFVRHPARVQSVLAAGANGYLLKTAATSDLLTGIRALGGGDTYLQTSLRLELARWRGSEDRVALTPKEEKVLRLLAAGETNAEVARQLGVSARTVENHRGRIKKKFGLRTRTELFQYAWDLGLRAWDGQ